MVLKVTTNAGPSPVATDQAAQLNTSAKAAEIELTEDGIAEEFAGKHVDDFRFDHDRGYWFCWKGTHWQMNKTNLAFDYARRLCRKHRGGRTKMATKNAVQGVEHMARSDPRLAVTSENWDRDSYLVGTPGGTVNLKSGVMQPAKRDDFITRLTTVTPAEKGTPCPVFAAYLSQAANGDETLVRFLQQWAGYCLTGSTNEQALLFIYGPGGNGKSVFVNVLTEIMGDYAKVASMQTFTASKQQRHLTEVAMLHGARLVTASETEKGQEWSEGRINSLTGSEPITANYMRQDHFTFVPAFKLTLIGNHKPKLGTVNEAARRRFNIVPFVHKPAQPDKSLSEKLRAEYPAILRWMIEGCLDWRANGLLRPQVVLNATTEYFEEQDTVGRWIKEACDLGPEKKATATALYGSWKDFAIANGESAGSQVTFASLLSQHGFEKKKSGGLSVYVGIAPKPVVTKLGKFDDEM